MNRTTRKKDEHSFKKELPSDNEPEQETDFIEVLNHLEDIDLEEGCPTDIFRLPIHQSCPKTIGLSSAYQYAFRGGELRQLCALEHACLCVLEKEHDQVSVQQLQTESSHTGRAKNATFDLHHQHILAQEGYIQRLVSQFRCPILAGRRLPPWQAVEGSIQLKKVWAAYIMTMFVPWSIKQPPNITWEAFQAWEKECMSPNQSYIVRNRYAMVQRLKMTGSVDKKMKVLSDLVRQQYRKIWGVPHPLDIQFSKEAEDTGTKEMQKASKECKFSAALDEIASALDKDVAAKNDARNQQMEDIKRSLETLFPMQDTTSPPSMLVHNVKIETSFQWQPARPSVDSGLNDQCDWFDVHSIIQRTYDGLRKENTTDNAVPTNREGKATEPRTLEGLMSTIIPTRTLDACQESTMDRIIQWALLDDICEPTLKAAAPLVAIHAGGGAGKSAFARELHERLAQVFGTKVLRACALSGQVASNLFLGSTCHHAIGLAIFGDECAAEGDPDTSGFAMAGGRMRDSKELIHRLTMEFQDCKVLVIDEMSMMSPPML